MSSEGEESQSTADRLSDEALARSTGYTWSEWFAILDAQGASEKSRAEVAQFLREWHGLSLWWANTINVGYERARTDRVEPERLGAYEVRVSKTFPVTVDRLFAAFLEPSGRERWLGDVDLRLRNSRRNRSTRFDWQDGSNVTAYFTDKGAKSAVRVQHGRLRTPDEAEVMKRYWRERLTELVRILGRS